MDNGRLNIIIMTSGRPRCDNSAKKIIEQPRQLGMWINVTFFFRRQNEACVSIFVRVLFHERKKTIVCQKKWENSEKSKNIYFYAKICQ